MPDDEMFDNFKLKDFLT